MDFPPSLIYTGTISSFRSLHIMHWALMWSRCQLMMMMIWRKTETKGAGTMGCKILDPVLQRKFFHSIYQCRLVFKPPLTTLTWIKHEILIKIQSCPCLTNCLLKGQTWKEDDQRSKKRIKPKKLQRQFSIWSLFLFTFPWGGKMKRK